MANNRSCSKRTVSRRNYYSEEEEGFDAVHKPYYLLCLRIKKASNVDQLVGAFVPTRNMSGFYQVTVTDSQYLREHETNVVIGIPEPIWEYDMRISFHEFPTGESLFLEVLQLASNRDPGTSSGRVVVGRVQIPVPTKQKDFGWRRYELVKLMGSEKKIEGFIDLHVELQEKLLKRNPTSCYK